MRKILVPISVLSLMLTAISGQALAADAPTVPYNISLTCDVGGEGTYWDYVTVDSDHRLVFVARGTHMTVLSGVTGAKIADIKGQKHSHGVALAPNAGRGFISDGDDGSIYVFDLKTYKVLGKIKTPVGADGINYDPVSDKVSVVSGKNSCITSFSPGLDLESGKADASIDLGGKPEFFVLDQGKAYVNLENKNEVVVVDLGAGKVTARWPVAPGGSPVSMAMDREKHHLFIGCRDPQKLIIMSSEDGKIIGEAPIGTGVDATQFDDGDIFSSARDGTLTITRETSSGHFENIQTLATKPWSKTIGLDPKTHTIYVPSADFEPSTAPDKRPKAKADTFALQLVNRTGDHPPWGKAKDNKIYGQQLVEQIVAEHSDTLADLGLHAIPAGGKQYVIVAQTMDKIGKQDSADDMEIIDRDGTKIYNWMIGSSPRFSAMTSLKDQSGKIIGLAVFSFKRTPGMSRLEVDKKMTEYMAEVTSHIPTVDVLFKPIQ